MSVEKPKKQFDVLILNGDDRDSQILAQEFVEEIQRLAPNAVVSSWDHHQDPTHNEFDSIEDAIPRCTYFFILITDAINDRDNRMFRMKQDTVLMDSLKRPKDRAKYAPLYRSHEDKERLAPTFVKIFRGIVLSELRDKGYAGANLKNHLEKREKERFEREKREHERCDHINLKHRLMQALNKELNKFKMEETAKKGERDMKELKKTLEAIALDSYDIVSSTDDLWMMVREYLPNADLPLLAQFYDSFTSDSPDIHMVDHGNNRVTPSAPAESSSCCPTEHDERGEVPPTYSAAQTDMPPTDRGRTTRERVAIPEEPLKLSQNAPSTVVLPCPPLESPEQVHHHMDPVKDSTAIQVRVVGGLTQELSAQVVDSLQSSVHPGPPASSQAIPTVVHNTMEDESLGEVREASTGVHVGIATQVSPPPERPQSAMQNEPMEVGTPSSSGSNGNRESSKLPAQLIRTNEDKSLVTEPQISLLDAATGTKPLPLDLKKDNPKPQEISDDISDLDLSLGAMPKSLQSDQSHRPSVMHRSICETELSDSEDDIVIIRGQPQQEASPVFPSPAGVDSLTTPYSWPQQGWGRQRRGSDSARRPARKSNLVQQKCMSLASVASLSSRLMSMHHYPSLNQISEWDERPQLLDGIRTRFCM